MISAIPPRLGVSAVNGDLISAYTMDHNGKLYIETVGCQMNVLDSELVVAALRQQGYELTSDPHEADTLLFNTCSVRELAEQKTYSSVGRFKYGKRRNPARVIGVIGCMAQQEKERVFERAPHVDLVVGTGQLADIPRLIEEIRRNRKRQLAVSLGRKDGNRAEVAGSFESYDPLRDPEMRPSPWQAYVRIMIGCDKFCTYCVVPNTRGPEQSRPPADIAREVVTLANQGVKEVTLLGQTVNSYKFTVASQAHGSHPTNAHGSHPVGTKTYRLSDLLALIHDTPGIERIKFVTNFPKDMTSDLLQAVRELPKVAHYLHVPLQSGCDEVLARMKRGYTTTEYREMMHRIREIIPDCAVSSDFIVGFCGESEASFQKSMDAVREYRFKNSFIFKYSPRRGTKAFELYADDVPDDVKKRRNNELLALQSEISEEDNAAFLGQTVQVLVEGPSKKATSGQEAGIRSQELGVRGQRPDVGGRRAEGGEQRSEGGGSNSETPSVTLNAQRSTLHAPRSTQLVGRTKCDRIVVFDGNTRLAGTLADVVIHDCTPTTLIGSILTHEVQHGSHELLPILT